MLHTHATAAPALVACWFAQFLALGCHGCTHGGAKSPTLGKQIAQGAGLPKLCSFHGLKECSTHMQVLPQHLWLVGLPSFWPQAALAAPMGVQVPNPWQADCTRCKSSQAVLPPRAHTVLHTHASVAPALVACWFAQFLVLGSHGCTHGVQVPNPWQADCTKCRPAQAVQPPWA